ncbi:hypothetical protein ADL15_26445 [Actinoplanes awajinensis subsp. mycoplanecinus]|uniref:Uncharacterized protein n=1 Tax=Actinoplanes awajinensis subsp. mycoplanecinus TaxID=135947 RepID=A0A101JN67_9ACTN|nr:hypothetical protein ADL15_26445 [Actinoplanes awajinensis subsp. mycoplanecinus]
MAVEIELWAMVGEPEALALAGPGATLLTGAGAAYAVGSDTLVVIGGGVSGEAHAAAEEMILPGPFPELIEERLAGMLRPVVHAFARMPDGCLALGAAQATELSYRRGALHDIRLRFEAPVPSDLLGRVPPGMDWLDLAVDDPVGAMERFIASWYAEIPERRETPAAAGLPTALRAFHRAAAGRPEVYGLTSRIYPEPFAGHPEELITFGQDGDGVVTVLMEPDGDDPRVYYDGLSDRLLPERERLSRYLLHATLARAAMDSPLGGMAFVDRPQARRVIAPLRRVPLQPMRWPSLFSRCYAGPGTVVLIGEDDADWFEMYVGVRRPGLLRRLRKLGLDWESFTDSAEPE